MSGNMTDMVKVHREGILYIVMGVLTTVINYIAYSLCVLQGINPNVSNVISWIVSVTFAFVTNKWIVFESKTWEIKRTTKEAVEFYGARIFTLLVSVVAFYAMYDILGTQYGVEIFSSNFLGLGDGFFSKGVVSLIEIVLNYVLSKFWVFQVGSKSE